MTRFLFGLLTACCITASGFSNPAPNAAPGNAEIQQAIRDLDSDLYRKRTVAARKLAAAGKAAIGPLIRAAETGTTTASDRATKILNEFAANSDPQLAAAGRDALEKLARGESPAREAAREFLLRFRTEVIIKLQKAGATLQYDDERVRAIYFDSVEDLKPLLPLLRELPEVTELSFSTKKFGDEEMKHLLHLKNLRWLNLFESNIGDEGLKLLKHFPRLESIPMGRTRVTNDGLKHLACLEDLDYLGLRGTQVTDVGLVHVKELKNLTGLTLEETKVTGTGFAHLKTLDKLNTLRLMGSAVDDTGLEGLHAIKSLRRIDLTGTKVTPAGIRKLGDAIPEAAITHRNGE